MCGIAGIATVDGQIDLALLNRMRDELRHRGPDDCGSWRSPDGRVGLAQRRLSIIDLSEGGHQPKLDAEGRSAITFNGEIYNYRALRIELEARGRRFASASDTEVLLAAYLEWGTGCLERLNGMFAFAIHDGPARRLFLARDRAGEKPLYWRCESGRLAFASELKGLMVDPTLDRRLDREALEHYLAYGYVPGDLCILAGVKKLAPAHALTFDLVDGRARTFRYWDLPRPPAEAGPGRAREREEELEWLLEDAVRLRLVSDVPVGILLSGGIDSSLVTAMAARSMPNVRTFTVAFPGSGVDEAAFAEQVAHHFGTQHVTIAAEPAGAGLLEGLARQFDEPLADSSLIPTWLVSKAVREHATVALGGDGGDELFGGYRHHSLVQSQERLRRLVPAAGRAAASRVIERLVPLGMRGRSWALSALPDLEHSLAQARFFEPTARARLLAPLGPSKEPLPEVQVAALVSAAHSPLQQATRADFLRYLPDDILAKVDRASMLTSLEVRAPLLDPRLIEFAFGCLPDALRATEHDNKILPRRLAARLLPAGLAARPKQGFSIPIRAWYSGSWGARLREIVEAADPALFDRGYLSRFLASTKWRPSNESRVFALAIFELWRREYHVRI
jgi:asparagine synthase (glutamine-hydrolysing)